MLAAVTVVMGVCMINEQITHQNIFGLLGGLSTTPQIREGKLRSQGAFDVYIDAGEFGAVRCRCWHGCGQTRNRGLPPCSE